MGNLAIWSNTTLWLGFALQVGLLLLILRQRLAAEAWVFSGLLLFYAVRSILLYGLAHRVSRAAYGELYTGLSLADLVLQAALAGELLIGVVRSARKRLVAGSAILVIATGLSLGLTALLPARSPVPADRAVIFFSTVFAALFCIAAQGRLRGWPRSLLAGLAFVGIAEIAAECGKSVAAFHRDGHAFVAWSYGNAAVYVLTLICWILASLRHGREEGPIRRTVVLHARGTI